MASKIMAILPRGREDSQPRSAVHGGMHGGAIICCHANMPCMSMLARDIYAAA